MVVGLGCWSVALRASFVTIAVPLLLVGSLFSEVALQLQVQSTKHLEYAAGEELTSSGLEGAAQKSAAAAVEDETEAISLQAQAAELNGKSLEEEQNAVDQRAEKAGGGTEADSDVAMSGEAKDLKVAVDAAAQDAADATSADDFSGLDSALKAAAKADAGEAGGADAVAVAGEASADTDAAAATAEGVTAGAVETDAATVGGPLGLAIATAGITAAVEAPKAVSAVRGVASQYKADRDEVVAAGDESQAAGLEADTVIEQDGADSAQTSASKELAVAGAYFMSAQVFQMLAFAFEAPVALVVIAQWTLGAGAVILGAKQCDNAVSASGAFASSLTLAAAVGSLLVSPWAQTVLYAASLEAVDPARKAVSKLPGLIEKAMQKDKNHSESGLKILRVRRLDGFDWMKAAQGMASGIVKDASEVENATAQVITKEAPVVGAAVQKGATQLAKSAEELTNETEKVITKEAPVVGAAVQNGATRLTKGAEELTNETEQVMAKEAPVVGGAVQQGAAQLTNETEEVVHKTMSKHTQQQALQALKHSLKSAETVAGSTVGAAANSISNVPKGLQQQEPAVGAATGAIVKDAEEGASQAVQLGGTAVGAAVKSVQKEGPAVGAAVGAFSKVVKEGASQVVQTATSKNMPKQASQVVGTADGAISNEVPAVVKAAGATSKNVDQQASKAVGDAAGAMSKEAPIVEQSAGAISPNVDQAVSKKVGTATSKGGASTGATAGAISHNVAQRAGNVNPQNKGNIRQARHAEEAKIVKAENEVGKLRKQLAAAQAAKKAIARPKPFDLLQEDRQETSSKPEGNAIRQASERNSAKMGGHAAHDAESLGDHDAGAISEGGQQGGSLVSQLVGDILKEAPVVGKAAGAISKNVEQQASKAVGVAAGAISKGVQQEGSQVSNETTQLAQQAEGFDKSPDAMQFKNATANGLHNAEEIGGKAEQDAEKLGGQAASAISKDAQQGASLVNQLMGNIKQAVPKDVKEQVPGILGAVTNVSGGLLTTAENMQTAAANTAGGAISQAVNAVPQNVRTAADAGLKNTQHAVGHVASAAANKAENLAAGTPNVFTTTVAPHHVPNSPNVTDSWSQFQPALSSVWNHMGYWVLPVLRSVLLISVVFAVAELFVAAGRHLPSHSGGANGHSIYAFRVLRDMYSQWLLGVALLVAAWVLSIIVAPSLKPFAETVLDQVDNASWSLATMQIVLCTTCLLACCGRATCLSRQECQYDVCEGKDSSNASREELKPIKSEKADQSESDMELQKDDEKASPSLLCMGVIAGFEAILVSAERPLAAWALGNSYRSFFTVRVLLGLLPWSYMAPTILSYTPSSPYELMIPVAAVAFLIGGLLVLAQRKQL